MSADSVIPDKVYLTAIRERAELQRNGSPDEYPSRAELLADIDWLLAAYDDLDSALGVALDETDEATAARVSFSPKDTDT